MQHPATIVYVDGFNFYSGAVRPSGERWIDLVSMSEALLPRNRIVEVRLYTAIVSERLSDPGKPIRQAIYHRALLTRPRMSLILGHFLTHRRAMPLAEAPDKRVTVLHTEEKGTDVNLATDLVHDAHRGRLEVAVVVSNDSDLARPIAVVSRDLKIPVGLVNPQRFRQSRTLARHANFIKTIRPGDLRRHRLPDRIEDHHGVILRPEGW